MHDTFHLGGDPPVNRTGFGAMRLPSQQGMGGPARDPETGRTVLRRAIELGVDHIDTADFYFGSDGGVRANTLIREGLHPYPSDLVIATKVGPRIGPDGLTHGTAADMRGLVEANLESLGTDRLDLVYLRVGAMEPLHGESIADRFESLAALREEGLIRHLGLSNVYTDHLTEARAIAPVVAVQNAFHVGGIGDRDVGGERSTGTDDQQAPRQQPALTAVAGVAQQRHGSTDDHPVHRQGEQGRASTRLTVTQCEFVHVRVGHHRSDHGQHQHGGDGRPAGPAGGIHHGSPPIQ